MASMKTCECKLSRCPFCSFIGYLAIEQHICYLLVLINVEAKVRVKFLMEFKKKGLFRTVKWVGLSKLRLGSVHVGL